jgi:hypothetical protein
MAALDLLAYAFGGAFLVNAIPHGVSGLMGRRFPSPFATPPGQGLSSATVNVLWAFFNLILAYGLLCHIGDFQLTRLDHAAALAFGMLTIGLFTARHFGAINGGNGP